MEDENHGKDFLLGAMIGSTVGALSAMMFTTKKGHNIQKDLLDKYHEFEGVIKKYAKGKTSQARKAAKKLVQAAKSKVAKTKKKLVKRAKKKVAKTKKAVRKTLKKHV